MIFSSQREREEEIERSAAFTGRLIRDSEKESRIELTEAAIAILREEALSAEGLQPTSEQPSGGTRRTPLNPLSAGIGLVLLGAAVMILIPPVGVALMACGALAVVWGLVLSATRSTD